MFRLATRAEVKQGFNVRKEFPADKESIGTIHALAPSLQAVSKLDDGRKAAVDESFRVERHGILLRVDALVIEVF